jgi:aminopeptidase N
MTKAFFAGLSLAATLLASSAMAAAGRLPVGVLPLAYDIAVEPDAAKLSFTGRETIEIQVTKPTRTITLNAAEITIASVTLNGTIAATVTKNEQDQTATFGFASPVKVGKHRLTITYSGKIYQSATGLFAIDYDNVDGTKDRMLATQFEAPDARRFAPMWDEPGIKTPFKLTAVSPAGQTAFSNMPVTSKATNAAGKTVWTFAETPKMSSYLLFLGMGNVERKTVMAGNVEIGVITRKGVVDQGDYALASAKRLLTHYNDYFGTPYPLPKMDMIAGPGSSQFFGAMENWGAIFYFERVLLIDPKLATESQKQDIFNVVAHEMAHQWFGDLVTMKWWDDLWLNEGFASWMASKASDDLNPEWGSLTQSVAFDRQGAIARDARVTTHPIIQHVETPDQISQAFDDITYRKGEAVIRMLEGAVGPDVFRDGVRRYMAKYKYGNTVTDNLWAEVAATSGKPVKPMMDSFTTQGGVPLIKVGNPTCTNGVTKVVLSQSRFGLDAGSKAAQTWLAPVRLAQAGTPGMGVAMSVSGTKPVTAAIPGCGLTVANYGQSAYFRTQYAPEHFEKLRAGFASLSVDDQVGLLADSYGLANSNDQSIEKYLSLLDTISPDASPLVWAVAAGQLGGIDRMLTDAPQQAAFRTKARALLAPVFAKVGWTAKPGEASAVALLREGLIPTLGSFGDTALNAQAIEYASKSFNDADSVPGAIRLPALSIFAYTADAARWDMLHEKAKAENSPVAKLLYYRSLGAVRDPALAQRALALTLTDEIPMPMRGNVIQAVASQHPALAFDWAVANVDMVNSFLEASTRSAFIVSLPSGSGDPAVAQRVTAFAEKTLPAASRKPAETAVAVINYRAGLRARQAGPIGAWAAK